MKTRQADRALPKADEAMQITGDPKSREKFEAQVAQIRQLLAAISKETKKSFGADLDHVDRQHVEDADRIIDCLWSALAIARHENY